MFVPAFEDNFRAVYERLYREEIEPVYDGEPAELLRRVFFISSGLFNAPVESSIRTLIEDARI